MGVTLMKWILHYSECKLVPALLLSIIDTYTVLDGIILKAVIL